MCGMSSREKHRALIGQRIAEAKSRIVEQYHRVRCGSGSVEFNAVVFGNMLLTYNLLLDELHRP